MAFPEDKLGLVVEIQPGGVWTDITAKCKTSDPIVHTRGIRNKGSLAEPATVPLKIDNKDGAFSPRNPMSPYYELLGLNTPVRLWIPDGSHFLDLDGGTANYATTPDNAALDIVGDIDLRAEAAINWYEPGANQVLIQKWDQPAGQRSYVLRVFDQYLYLSWSTTGIDNLNAFWLLPALPERAAVRATLDVDDGGGQFVARLYWAETIAGPWTQIGEDITGPATSIFAGTAPLQIGGSDPSTDPPRTPFTGKGYTFEVRNGIGGTVVAAPDFTAQPLGAAGFTDSAGRVWSYAGNAGVADRQDVFQGEISTWPQRWVPSGQAVWTPVTASGMLRRLGQGAKPLDSTLRRRIPSGSPIAYWPFEEDSDASSAYSPITGVAPAAVTGVEWAAVDTLPSSKPLPRLTAAATLSAIVPEHDPAGQWQVEFVYNADDKVPPADQPHPEVISISTTGTVRRWVVGMRSGTVRLFGYDSSGTDIVFRSFAVGGDVFHGWVRMRLFVSETGGTVSYTVGFQDIGGDTGAGSGTVSGTSGRVTAITGNWTAPTEGWAIGHLSVLPQAASTLYSGSDRAYSGETAWERLARLAGEEGVPMARIPGGLTPERVGPQRVAKLLEVFQAAADADGGMLLEDRHRPGLVYRDRSSMYTQEPALTLTYRQPPLAPPLEPDDDADVTRNDRTVKRDGGSEARAVLREGRLSIQDPPDGIGLYDDSVTLSLASDTQAGPIAYWLLHLGTYDGARYPQVTIRLHRAPELIPDVLAMREGDLIRLKGLPGFVAYGDVDLIVTGWSETLLPRTWERTFVCEPGGPWNTAKASHTVYGKAGTDGSRLAAAVTADTTSLPVRATADGLPWVSANPVLNANPDFADDLTSWSAFDATIARIAAPPGAPFRGDWVLQVTPNGVGEFPNAGSEQIPVVPGLEYVLSGWLRCATSRNVALNANWFDAGFGYLTTSANDQAVTADTWTWFEATFTAPGGAANVNLSPTVPNFPPSTDVLLAAKVTWRRAGGMPKEFPIPIQAGGEVMAANAITLALVDTFTRTTTPGWGTPDIGAAWVSSGGAGGDHYTQGAEAAHLLTNVDVPRLDVSPVAGADHDVQVDVATFALATGGPQLVAVVARATDGDNCYMGQLSISTTQTITLTLRKRVGGVETQLATTTTSLTHSAFAFFRLRLQVIGDQLKARVWPAGGTEPGGWQVTATDTALTTGSNVGCRSVRETANTNTDLVVSWDNVALHNPQQFIVERSVNGVVKAHAADGPVRAAHPAIAPL